MCSETRNAYKNSRSAKPRKGSDAVSMRSQLQFTIDSLDFDPVEANMSSAERAWHTFHEPRALQACANATLSLGAARVRVRARARAKDSGVKARAWSSARVGTRAGSVDQHRPVSASLPVSTSASCRYPLQVRRSLEQQDLAFGVARHMEAPTVRQVAAAAAAGHVAPEGLWEASDPHHYPNYCRNTTVSLP